jgi:hypothetical protein
VYARFWGQAVRFLAGEDRRASGPGLSVRLDRGEATYRQGDPVTLLAQVRGQSGELTPFAEVRATLAREESGGSPQTLRLSPSPGNPGEYEGTATPAHVGRHEVTVSARAAGDGQELGRAQLKLVVEPSEVETARVDIDPDTLESIAAAAGGSYVTLEHIGELLSTLRARQSERRRAISIPFWNAPVFFFALVCAAGVEWFLRRRMQLA